MFIKDIKFTIVRSPYAERHFVKNFKKKYGDRKWEKTELSFYRTLERIFNYQQTALIDTISFSSENNCGIFKLDFSIAGENKSAKTSGNFLIFAVSNEKALIEILLIYGKSDCSKSSETQWIKEQIKENFTEYKKYCI